MRLDRRALLAGLASVPTAALGQALVVPSCGSAGLKAGATHYLTIDPNGELCGASASTRKEPPKTPEPPPPKEEPKR